VTIDQCVRDGDFRALDEDHQDLTLDYATLSTATPVEFVSNILSTTPLAATKTTESADEFDDSNPEDPMDDFPIMNAPTDQNAPSATPRTKGLTTTTATIEPTPTPYGYGDVLPPFVPEYPPVESEAVYFPEEIAPFTTLTCTGQTVVTPTPYPAFYPRPSEMGEEFPFCESTPCSTKSRAGSSVSKISKEFSMDNPAQTYSPAQSDRDALQFSEISDPIKQATVAPYYYDVLPTPPCYWCGKAMFYPLASYCPKCQKIGTTGSVCCEVIRELACYHCYNLLHRGKSLSNMKNVNFFSDTSGFARNR
jgi:hypothetical protein